MDEGDVAAGESDGAWSMEQGFPSTRKKWSQILSSEVRIFSFEDVFILSITHGNLQYGRLLISWNESVINS